MANSTVRRSEDRDRRRKEQVKSKPLPLVTRRIAAWTVEVSLIALSGLVPYSLGIAAKSDPTGEQVTLNPVVTVTTDAIAKTLGLPVSETNSKLVTPLTNVFWSAAVVAPLLLTGWQLYLLSKTGSTLPKRWFRVRVVTAAGTVPSLPRILLREGIGVWGLPLSIAYILWRSCAFPHLGVLAGLSCLMVLGEGITARFHRQRRCWHDLIAGTYVVDANRTFKPLPLVKAIVQPTKQNKSYPRTVTNGIVTSPARVTSINQRGHSWWKWMRRNPTITLLLVSLTSLATVLGTLVGTQVYIQTQKNQRQLVQSKSEQFLSLIRQLSTNSATLDDRQRAILALGTIEDPQVLKLLVELLGQETKGKIVNAVQQALVSTGPQALPYLHNLNQLLSNEIAAGRYTNKPAELAVRTQQLQATQQAIAKILLVYSGKLPTLDLSRTNLGSTTNAATTFNLALDQVNLAGIGLKGANLNAASLPGSIWRAKGEDDHWDTFDDAIADLNDAQMKAANLTGANLSRVPMNRINLMRSNLNHANLSNTSLNDANLSSAQLVGANLQNAVLVNASLTGANLGAANLSDANLYTARLSRVSALGTKLQSANLAKSDWQGADLSSSDLSGANLSNADLSMTRLSSTNLSGVQMQNINLRNADLRLADLRGANLAHADFQGAILFSAKQAQSDQFIAAPPEYTQSALVKGVDFSKVKNLAPNQIAYICTAGGSHPRCP